MIVKRLAVAALAAAVSFGTVRESLAEDQPVSARDLHALIQRLEKAEKRIRELEVENADLQAQPQPAPQRLPEALPGSASGQIEPAVAQPAAYEDSITIRQTAALVDPEDTVSERLKSLDNRWIELEKRETATEKLLDEFMIKDGTSRSTMTISGRIHGDFWSFPETDQDIGRLDRNGNPQDRLIWRRVRFGVKGKIKDNMHYKIEMEFADPNDTQYRDLYVGFDELPFLQTVRIGNQKRPLGLDHINSSRYNVFLERPAVVEGFNQDARRLGIVSYGVTDDLKYNWRYGVYNPELTQDDEGYTGDHWQMQIAGRLASTAWWDECTEGRSYWHWAVSGSSVWPDGTSGRNHDNEARFDTRPEARTSDDWLDTGEIADAEDYQQLGLETALNLGPLQLVGELEQTWVHRGSLGQDVYLWGGYGYVSYFLTGEHMPWDRKTGQLGRPKPFQNFWIVNTCDDCTEAGWGAWQIAARYSYADFNDHDIYGGQSDVLTIGLNWYWNPNSRLQFNYLHGQISNSNTARAAASGGPASGNFNVFGARFMVDF